MDSRTVLRNAGKASGAGKYYGAIKYKGEEIAQWHNPKLFIQDILGENRTKQFTSILLIGGMGSGKTTLRKFINHEIHTQDDFLVYNLTAKELATFDTFIDTLPNRNLILNFEDVSLVFKTLKDPAQRNRILQTMTEARHPKFENSDRRIITISEIHYLHATEKMHRSLGSWKFWTDLSTEELQNFNHMTKGRYNQKAEIFAKTVTNQFRKGKFEVSLTNKKRRIYETNKPFRFVMCFDNINLRFFLVPAESCAFCSSDKGHLRKTKATPQQIIKLAEKYYKKDGVAGLKQALLFAGHTHQFRNNLVYAMNTAKEILATFDVNKEELADVLRKRAQIPDKRLYTIKAKKKNFEADLEAIVNEQTSEAPKEADLDLDL